MREVLLAIIFVPVAMMTVQSAPAKENPRLERIEWTDIWVAGADQSDLPKVLMVGDSIARGYFNDVEKHLSGEAHCARFATSMFMSNPDYLATLKIILGRHRFSVIHVNNGLHGWEGYSEEQYRQALPKLMETLRKYGQGAVIVWATATPRRDQQNQTQLSSDNGRVLERNRIAVEYMKQHGIAVDDLYSLVADHPEYYSLPLDTTHFNYRGRALEGEQVSKYILQALTAIPGGGKAHH